MEAAEAGRLHIFRPEDGGEEHYAIEIGRPDRHKPVLTRLHSACFTGDLLGSLKCDCGPQLKAALDAQARRLIRADEEGGREVTILGDRTVPYSLLRKVMATCTEADFGRVSLAVGPIFGARWMIPRFDRFRAERIAARLRAVLRSLITTVEPRTPPARGKQSAASADQTIRGLHPELRGRRQDRDFRHRGPRRHPFDRAGKGRVLSHGVVIEAEPGIRLDDEAGMVAPVLYDLGDQRDDGQRGCRQRAGLALSPILAPRPIQPGWVLTRAERTSHLRVKRLGTDPPSQSFGATETSPYRERDIRISCGSVSGESQAGINVQYRMSNVQCPSWESNGSHLDIAPRLPRPRQRRASREPGVRIRCQIRTATHRRSPPSPVPP